MIKVIIIVAIIGAVLYYLFPMIQVIGDSMYPTYKDGEIIFGTRLYRKSKLKKGDVVLYKSPMDDNRTVIKRIERIKYIDSKPAYFFCLGDNPEHSYDSRYYGSISSYGLVCKVINQRRNKNDVCN